ncbi:6-bladed beta-propeller [Candidatus Aminicenantes bacterium AH-873-B07]|jgi:hypothetical protein|nr:6-bladed beta-propeller [Candidatus Aminicenantes bacterium AH-873-B07]
MRKSKITILLFVFIFLIFYPIHAGKIKIKTEKGVKVIYNPRKPSPQKSIPTKLVLKEEFTIGKGEKEEEMISELFSFAVDNEGKIYILDRRESVIKVFDNKGKYLMKIGKQGQGPGEMNKPIGIRITKNNELIIEDILNQRLIYFSLDGKFLRNFSTAKILGFSGAVIDSKGNIIGRQLVPSPQKITWEIKKFDNKLNPLFTIYSTEFQNPLQGKFNPFNYLNYFEIDDKDFIYFGDYKEYEIKVFNPKGKLAKRIRKEYKPVKITEKNKKEFFNRIPPEASMFKDRIEFPKYYPPYQSFVLADNGRLIVRTFERGKKEGEYYYDVFDKEGRYIAKILLKGEIRIWKKNRLYSIEENEEGFRILKCYRAFWKL